MNTARRVYTMEVEFELYEVSDEDLLAELRERKLNSDYNLTVDELYEEYSKGNRERTLEMLRVYLMDVTGRVLP